MALDDTLSMLPSNGAKKPPTDQAKRSELYLALTQSEPPSREFTWRMRGNDYRIRIESARLATREHVYHAAFNYFKGKGYDDPLRQVTSDVWEAEYAIQVLVRCVKKPERIEKPDGSYYHQAVFASADELRDEMTANELGSLLALFESVQNDYPDSSVFDDGRTLEQWVDALAEGARDNFLEHLGLHHAVELLQALAREVYVSKYSQRSSLHNGLDVNPKKSEPENISPMPQASKSLANGSKETERKRTRKRKSKASAESASLSSPKEASEAELKELAKKL